MISLFLDTSSSNMIIGVYEDDKELYLNIEKSNNDLSEKLLPSIKNALESINKKIDNIDNIYVVNGPGSFTGIRIGVTVAKTISWSLNKKINTISELELLSSGDYDKKYIIPMIDARRNYVYAGIYDNNGNNVYKDSYISIDNLLNKVKEITSLDDFKFVSYDEIDLKDVEKPNINVLKLIKKYKDVESLNPHFVNPNYLKKTEAEEKLNDN